MRGRPLPRRGPTDCSTQAESSSALDYQKAVSRGGGGDGIRSHRCHCSFLAILPTPTTHIPATMSPSANPANNTPINNGDGHLKVRSFDKDSYESTGTYATSNAAAVTHPYAAQRIGSAGPLLLANDFHLVDLLSHFDRERIPERVVHAKGGGAHGTYRTTHPIPHLTKAKIFAEAQECDVSVRFSTVGGESGSPDAARDPRGFSIKFRTEESTLR